MPADLHFQDVDEADYITAFTCRTFQNWLTEGRHNCDIAQALVHTWVNDIQTSAHDTLADFFQALLEASADDDLEPGGQAETLPLLFVASFIKKHCAFDAALHGCCAEDRITEIAELIADEVAVVDAYLTAWRGTGAAEAPPQVNVETNLRSATAQKVPGWPRIDKDPVKETSDGRLVKAHPLTFPTGCGDLRQSRLRIDFSPLEWTQHAFRYFDGRVLSTMRGQRAVWACFNSALRDMAHQSGAILHKQSGHTVLTKDDLQNLVRSRDDLVSKLTTFGAELPSTAMHWKRSGRDVEWIVRQMFWAAPWTDAGKAAAMNNLARKSRRRTELEAAAPNAPVADAAPAPAPREGSGSDASSEHSPLPRSDTDESQERSGDDDNQAPAQDTSKDDGGTAAASPGAPSSDDATNLKDLASVWRHLPTLTKRDDFGYGRSPGFWFTLNFAYNHACEVHRFQDAVSQIKGDDVLLEDAPQTPTDPRIARAQ